MLLNQTNFFVREQVGLLKLTDVYDILDPATQKPLGVAKDEPSALCKYLRLVVNKHFLPTTINVYEDGQSIPAFSILKPVSLLRSTVTVTDRDGMTIGTFKSKIFSFGGGFWVHDEKGRQVAEVKGDWKGWNFRFLGPDGAEWGTVTKKWAGIGKELFTSADNYIISIDPKAAGTEEIIGLLLAAGLAIDTVYKENR